MEPNAQYSLLKPSSLAARIAGVMRRRMYECFMMTGGIRATDTILDVGVTSDRTYDSSNYLEAWYPQKNRLTAVGIDDAAFLTDAFPGIRFVRANGKFLPFADNSFDVVHSSAVIEHVGSRAEQARFTAELYRVARRMACITTPNRWFPVEVHTSLPLVHWLPPRHFRKLLRNLKLTFFSDEANLNLLGYSELIDLCRPLKPQRLVIERMRLAGWTSNLIAFIWR
ncbi:MAG: class I SAM-dependent methyltransferase [Rhodospirillales bacterium]|jgi:hypothetical protein|nr:class I SAM-dependent methyltransferase [Rhodospirillales bacterium]